MAHGKSRVLAAIQPARVVGYLIRVHPSGRVVGRTPKRGHMRHDKWISPLHSHTRAHGRGNIAHRAAVQRAERAAPNILARDAGIRIAQAKRREAKRHAT